MNGKEKAKIAQQLEATLEHIDRDEIPLVGVRPFENRIAFVRQLVDSLQRVSYMAVIADRKEKLDPARTDPTTHLFDPLQAAVLLKDSNSEEACWLVFLATHCGKNLRLGWRLSQELYGGLGGPAWTWNRVKDQPSAMRTWLRDHRGEITGAFGNHRKYETLKDTDKGTGAVVASYIEWVMSHGSHAELFAHASADANGDPRKAFGALYQEMKRVRRFGRTGKFDYLTMIAKTGLAKLQPDLAYLKGATGPLRGARLLFDGQIDSKSTARDLESRLAILDRHLKVGMQVLEDSMCNWQKSPNQYVAFRG